MYMRHYTPEPEERDSTAFDLPKNYAGHLFRAPEPESDTPPPESENPFQTPPFGGTGQEACREGEEPTKESPPPSDKEEAPKKAKTQPVFGWFDKTFGKLRQKDWFSSDLIILAIAVFLLCDDDGDDNLLPLLLLLFFIK